MIVIRDVPFICAVFHTLRSSQVDCTALAAAAVLLLPGFVLDAVAPSAGGWENCSPQLSASSACSESPKEVSLNLWDSFSLHLNDLLTRLTRPFIYTFFPIWSPKALKITLKVVDIQKWSTNSVIIVRDGCTAFIKQPYYYCFVF